MPTTVIECRGLTKCYDARHPEAVALRSVDLAVERGEMVAIMGPSGCGKSTLLHLIGGLDVPTSGSVMLNGERFDDLSEAKRAVLRRRHVGYVFQFFNLITNLTVAENVELPMLLAGYGQRAARSRRMALLDRLGVGAHADKPPSELSGGQQQRVALARALANDPEVLLADEPTGNLDSEATGEVIGMLRDYHADGQTIILVTHDQRVGSIADRLLRMEDGEIRAETSSPAVVPSTTLSTV
ncbi:MAG: ABC transporter ATP-binding protein [Ilumatobacteraceae bacterium]